MAQRLPGTDLADVRDQVRVQWKGNFELEGRHQRKTRCQNKSLKYDTVSDFQMLSQLILYPFVLAVRQDHPLKSMADLIAYLLTL